MTELPRSSAAAAAEVGRSPSRPALTERIYGVLDGIYDPCSVATSVPMGLAEMGLVESVEVSDAGEVTIGLRLTSPFCEMFPFMKAETIRAVGALDGVGAVTVRHDAGLDWDHDLIAPAARRRRELRLSVLRRTAGAP
jgi:metal-sulfur cluster biosynthetic enzyme